MLRSSLILLSIFSLFLVADCLDEPNLRTCGEFPFGTEGCGSACDVYCGEMLQRCPDLYPSASDCQRECSEPPGGGTIAQGAQGDTEGNTLACRITQALEGNCGEASLDESPSCEGDLCETYCETMENTICADAYSGIDNCLANCALLPPGTTDEDANTVACRQKYALAATIEPSPATCNAASAPGGNVCGQVCEVYCDLLEINCTGDNTIYPDRTSCLDTCNLMETEGIFTDWDFDIQEDSVQCRIYHAGAPAAAQPDVHCPHTSVYNIEHCGIDPALNVQPRAWPCPTFCSIVEDECPGLYSSEDECLSACEGFPEIVGLGPGEAPNIYPVSSLVCPSR